MAAFLSFDPKRILTLSGNIGSNIVCIKYTGSSFAEKEGKSYRYAESQTGQDLEMEGTCNFLGDVFTSHQLEALQELEHC